MHHTNWFRMVGALAVACAVTAQPGLASAAGPDQAADVQPAVRADAGPIEQGAQVPVLPVPGSEPKAMLPEGVFGSTIWGGRGIHRLASGFGTPSQALVLSVSTGYSKVSGVFIAKDRNSRSDQSVDLAYTPVHGLELSASYRMMVDNYAGLVQRSLQTLGNPALRAKYGHRLAGPVAVGLQVAATMPTSALGHGLASWATGFDALALVSWQAHPRIEVVGNIGYSLDRSNHIFSANSADALQRHAYQINRVSQVPYGVGAQGRVTLGHRVDLQPFAEVTGGFGLGGGANLQNDPFRLSAGAKVYPTSHRVLELVVGSDVALGGRPRAHSPFGGQPAWEFFAHLHAHLGEIIRLAVRPSVGSSTSGAAAMAQIVADPTRDMATFRLAGHVVDADTGKSIFGARVVVGEAEDILLATDDATGAFHSWPISAGLGLIRVTAKASGYQDEQKVVPRPAANEVVTLSFAPKAELAAQRLATLKGTLIDVRTGHAIGGGHVRIDALNLRVTADAQGGYSLRTKPGRHTVTFEAGPYRVVQRALTLRPNETLLFNAEMKPE